MSAPPPPSTVARLTTSADVAARVVDAFVEQFETLDAVAAMFEEPTGGWGVAIHFAGPPNETAVRALVALAAGAEAANALVFETVAAKDWVEASLAGLPPVDAGRFVVHGSHDRARVGRNRIGIEIEAALAFGTGHHGTTRGCLLALDLITKAWPRARRCCSPPPAKRSGAAGRGRGWGALASTNAPHPVALRAPTLPTARKCSRREGKKEGASRVRKIGSRILDIGTGLGVLAIAAARALHRPVLASDIDPLAVRIARGNARHNRAGAAIEIIRAHGLASERFQARAPFDLVFANILLKPVIDLATPMRRLLAARARIVLSGLLLAHGTAALDAYVARGFALERRIVLGGWVTLVLRLR